MPRGARAVSPRRGGSGSEPQATSPIPNIQASATPSRTGGPTAGNGASECRREQQHQQQQQQKPQGQDNTPAGRWRAYLGHPAQRCLVVPVLTSLPNAATAAGASTATSVRWHCCGSPENKTAAPLSGPLPLHSKEQTRVKHSVQQTPVCHEQWDRATRGTRRVATPSRKWERARKNDNLDQKLLRRLGTPRMKWEDPKCPTRNAPPVGRPSSGLARAWPEGVPATTIQAQTST